MPYNQPYVVHSIPNVPVHTSKFIFTTYVIRHEYTYVRATCCHTICGDRYVWKQVDSTPTNWAVLLSSSGGDLIFIFFFWLLCCMVKSFWQHALHQNKRESAKSTTMKPAQFNIGLPCMHSTSCCSIVYANTYHLTMDDIHMQMKKKAIEYASPRRTGNKQQEHEQQTTKCGEQTSDEHLTHFKSHLCFWCVCVWVHEHMCLYRLRWWCSCGFCCMCVTVTVMTGTWRWVLRYNHVFVEQRQQ